LDYYFKMPAWLTFSLVATWLVFWCVLVIGAMYRLLSMRLP
jgi:hypothetical protein